MLAIVNVTIVFSGYGFFSFSGFGGHVQNFKGPLHCRLKKLKMKKSSRKSSFI
jgi:hypothetical protein